MLFPLSCVASHDQYNNTTITIATSYSSYFNLLHSSRKKTITTSLSHFRAHNYEEISLEEGRKGKGTPQLTEYAPNESNAPQEMIVHVTVEQDSPEKMNSESTAKFEQSLVTLNPFYSDLPEAKLNEIETGATSRHDYLAGEDYNQEKMETPNQHKVATDIKSSTVESALHFDQVEDIEGDIIEEIDYQNVTIIRTKVTMETEVAMEGAKGASTSTVANQVVQAEIHSSCLSVDSKDYINVEIDHTSPTNCDERAFSDYPIESTFRQIESSSENPDTKNVDSSDVYHNFAHPKRILGADWDGAREDLVTEIDKSVDASESCTDELKMDYMNVPYNSTSREKLGSNVDYENITFSEHKSKCL